MMTLVTLYLVVAFGTYVAMDTHGYRLGMSAVGRFFSAFAWPLWAGFLLGDALMDSDEKAAAQARRGEDAHDPWDRI